MDYLTVPPASTILPGEGYPPGGPAPPGSMMSELTVPMPPMPDISASVSATSEKKGRRRPSKQLSKLPKQPRAGLKVRRHKEKRKQKSMKDSVKDVWGKVKPKLNRLRKIIRALTQSFYFEIYIFTVVGINTSVLVAQTFAIVEIRGEWFFTAMDPVFLCIYLMEVSLKIFALDVKFFRDCWNNIDFFIILMTILDFALSLNMYRNQYNSLRTFRILKICKGLRAIRAIRYILTLKVMKSLKEAASTFAISAKSIGAIIILMFSFLCMFAVVLHDIFENSDPKHFGDIFKTIFTLFQFLTLDDWSIVYLKCRAAGAWYIIFFLIIYILVEYFLLLNLVIAVLVDNFQTGLLRRQELLKQKQRQILMKEASEVAPSPEPDRTPAWAQQEKATESEEDRFFRDMIKEKYGKLALTPREQQLFYNYFLTMLAIETTQQQFISQAATSDKIVDTFFETSNVQCSPD